MASRFIDQLRLTEQTEGDTVVREPSGENSFRGLYQPTYDAYNRRKGTPLKDVSTITPQEFRVVRNQVFIQEPKIDTLPQPIAGLVFDFGFQSSPTKAIKTLQGVVGVKQDGKIGPKTRKAVKDLMQEDRGLALSNTYLDKRKEFLLSLVKNHPDSHGRMKGGYIDRVETLRRGVDNVLNR